MNLQSRKTIEKTRFQNKIFLKFLLFTTYNPAAQKSDSNQKIFFLVLKKTPKEICQLEII